MTVEERTEYYRTWRNNNREKCKQSSRTYRAKNREKTNMASRKYLSDHCRSGCTPVATRCNAGQAAEHFVGADLLHRGLEVTKPLNVNGPDDLHVRVSTGWLKVQVKVAKVNTKTGRFMMSGGSGGKAKKSNMTSDILALVDLIDRRIEYEPLRGTVPPELLDEV